MEVDKSNPNDTDMSCSLQFPSLVFWRSVLKQINVRPNRACQLWTCPMNNITIEPPSPNKKTLESVVKLDIDHML